MGDGETDGGNGAGQRHCQTSDEDHAMTMSVGLGRIIVDPAASVLVRKALGALSTPGLLVYDDALTIDDTGRITLRLKEGGGLVNDSDGLYTEITVGIDSHVDLVSDEYDREWNARLTGTAPNFIESRLLIGSELENNAPGIIAAGQTLDTPMVNIWNSLTQLRLSFDADKFTSFRTTPDGELQIFAVGNTSSGSNVSNAGIHLITGDGTVQSSGIGYGGFRLNGGDQIELIELITLTYSTTGGGTVGTISWEEKTFSITGATYPDADTSLVMSEINSSPGATNIIGAIYGMTTDNTVFVRISWFDTLAANIILTFNAMFIRFRAGSG